MKIRVLGGGWFGCHIACALLHDGHAVELHEIADRLFAGASGGNPARLHQGQHYPRSGLTRKACQEHNAEFLATYGELVRSVPVNIYAIAEHNSLVDFLTYCKILAGEIEYIKIDPGHFGLTRVEGAIQTGEKHIVIDDARKVFTHSLKAVASFGVAPGLVDDPDWDWTIDCTFCANDELNINRYEPCVTTILEGPKEPRAVTIMDGPFPSIYPWDERQNLYSLTSALHTPISKSCKTYKEAKNKLAWEDQKGLDWRGHLMLAQMSDYWPSVLDEFKVAGHLLAVRALPLSAADARLVDVVQVGEHALRIRAGKIDAIFQAERLIKKIIQGGSHVDSTRRFQPDR